MVLGFPCNQFTPGAGRTRRTIKQFCFDEVRRDVPDVREGERERATDTHPLFALPEGSGARARSAPGAMKWNFTKFLVDREGNVVRRFGPAAGA